MSNGLEGLEGRPVEVQVAVLINEIRNLRRAVREIDNDVVWMRRTMLGLLVTIIAGLLIYALAVPHP